MVEPLPGFPPLALAYYCGAGSHSACLSVTPTDAEQAEWHRVHPSRVTPEVGLSASGRPRRRSAVAAEATIRAAVLASSQPDGVVAVFTAGDASGERGRREE